MQYLTYSWFSELPVSVGLFSGKSNKERYRLTGQNGSNDVKTWNKPPIYISSSFVHFLENRCSYSHDSCFCCFFSQLINLYLFNSITLIYTILFSHKQNYETMTTYIVFLPTFICYNSHETWSLDAEKKKKKKNFLARFCCFVGKYFLLKKNYLYV